MLPYLENLNMKWPLYSFIALLLLTKRFLILWKTLAVMEKFLFDNSILRFQHCFFFCYIKFFWLIASGVLIFQWKVLISPGIHVTSICLLKGIIISVIWLEKSILWAFKNKNYFLHSCSVFLNFKLFIQSIMMRHTSVENP